MRIRNVSKTPALIMNEESLSLFYAFYFPFFRKAYSFDFSWAAILLPAIWIGMLVPNLFIFLVADPIKLLALDAYFLVALAVSFLLFFTWNSVFKPGWFSAFLPFRERIRAMSFDVEIVRIKKKLAKTRMRHLIASAGRSGAGRLQIKNKDFLVFERYIWTSTGEGWLKGARLVRKNAHFKDVFLGYTTDTTYFDGPGGSRQSSSSTSANFESRKQSLDSIELRGKHMEEVNIYFKNASHAQACASILQNNIRNWADFDKAVDGGIVDPNRLEQSQSKTSKLLSRIQKFESRLVDTYGAETANWLLDPISSYKKDLGFAKSSGFIAF